MPYFLDIDRAPKGIMPFLHRKLLVHVKHGGIPGVGVKGCGRTGDCEFGIHRDRFDAEEYESVACSLLKHTKAHLTTKALAEYALRVTGNLPASPSPPGSSIKMSARNSSGTSYSTLPKVLFLGGSSHWSDYLRDMMFHGFRDLLGDKLFE